MYDKREKMNKKSFLCVLMSVLLVSGAAACGSAEGSAGGNDSDSSLPTISSNSEKDRTSSSDVSDTASASEEEADKYLKTYSPKLFGGDVSYRETVLCDGLTMVLNTVEKSNGDVSFVYALEIDLDRVDIHAGTKDNAVLNYSWAKAVPYAQAQAWERATGGQVYAAINADFFGSTCVNAFVKDGIIVKAGHNDNGNYDYLNETSDVPASAPMLFGVKDGSAQIAPIIRYTGDVVSPAVKEKLVRAKLSYKARISGATEEMTVAEGVKADETNLAFNTVTSRTMRSGTALKVDVSEGYANMKVLEKLTISSSKTMKPVAGVFAYLQAATSNAAAVAFLERAEAGGTVSFSVSSPDGAWDGYETVLGCRQALVVDGEIASTVTLENTNGAQRNDIPRTAVGIREDGMVVLFAVESMYYGNLSKTDADGHGMSLPELAEFMYYYRCKQGANFDGGGSTQLTVRAAGERASSVVIRSSDTGSTDLFSSRPVMNSFLVTSKFS